MPVIINKNIYRQDIKLNKKKTIQKNLKNSTRNIYYINTFQIKS